MSKSRVNVEVASRLAFLALLALLVFGGLYWYVLIFYIPIVGWFVWRYEDRISELEKRLAAVEKPAGS
jgi:hypothetical protein